METRLTRIAISLYTLIILVAINCYCCEIAQAKPTDCCPTQKKQKHESCCAVCMLVLKDPVALIIAPVSLNDTHTSISFDVLFPPIEFRHTLYSFRERYSDSISIPVTGTINLTFSARAPPVTA